jgi:glycosyltransferase involved in cell wall biosynthesis
MNGYERRQGTRDEFRVGYFARVAPEKGLHILAEAYVRLRRRTGRRRSASKRRSSHLDPRGVPAGVRRTLDHAGLGGEFSYRGELDRAGKLAFLRDLDVCPSGHLRRAERDVRDRGNGERGPVVQPRRGGFTEIVEQTGEDCSCLQTMWRRSRWNLRAVARP